MTIYRLKEIVCESMLVTPTTPVEDLYAFGVLYAEAAADGSGINVAVVPNQGGTFVTGDMYILKCVAPLLKGFQFAEILTPSELAERYEEIVSVP